MTSSDDAAESEATPEPLTPPEELSSVVAPAPAVEAVSSGVVSHAATKNSAANRLTICVRI